MDLYKFEPSLVYSASSQTARKIKRNSVLKSKQNNKKIITEPSVGLRTGNRQKHRACMGQLATAPVRETAPKSSCGEPEGWLSTN